MCSFLFLLLLSYYLLSYLSLLLPFFLPPVLLWLVCSSLPSILQMFLYFQSCSLTFSCIHRLTLSSSLTPPPFYDVLFHPPLLLPHLPTCPRSGQPRTSPLSICPFVLYVPCSVFLPLLSPSIFLSLSPVSGLVELGLVLLPPSFACVIFNRILCWFGC